MTATAAGEARNAPPRIMVCVTGQRSCGRYILQGRRLCDELGGELSVVHIAGAGRCFMDSPREGEALEYLFQEARKHGAEMTVRRAADVVAGLLRQARHDGATHIVVGGAQSDGAIEHMLRARLPHVEVIVVPGDA